MRYRVAYLTTVQNSQGRAIDTRKVWADPVFETPERATRYMKALKRRGLTVWVENEHGDHVPVPGAKSKGYQGMGMRPRSKS